MSFSEEQDEQVNLCFQYMSTLTVFFLGGILGLVHGLRVDVVLP